MPGTGGVEVIIAHRNNYTGLRRTLAALAGQTTPTAVCVVDDASDDETPACLPGDHAEVRYVRLDDNVGFGAANNRGVMSSTAEFVILLNNDTVPEPDFVEQMLAAREAAGAGTVAGCLRSMDGRVDSLGIGVDRSLIAFDVQHGEAYDPGTRPEPIAPCGGAGGYDRASFTSVGGFDERMFLYLEDVDLGLRLAMAGVRCVAAPSAVAWHEHSASLGSASPAKNERMGESRAYLMWKYRRDLSVGERLRGAVVDGVVYCGQLAIDRNAGAFRGRARRWRSLRGTPSPPRHPGFERVVREPLSTAAVLHRRLGRRR